LASQRYSILKILNIGQKVCFLLKYCVFLPALFPNLGEFGGIFHKTYEDIGDNNCTEDNKYNEDIINSNGCYYNINLNNLEVQQFRSMSHNKILPDESQMNILPRYINEVDFN